MSYNVGMISLGCAKNLVNSEQMLFLLSEAGNIIAPEVSDCDVVIINTCGFIDSAKSEAISHILEMVELKKSGNIKKIIVAGCLPQRYQDEVLNEFPEVDALIGVGSFDDIVIAVDRVFKDERFILAGDNSAPVEETGRVLSTGPAWAYLKIAEGCDNFCAFCAIPKIRGRYRSRPFQNIIDEAQALCDSGVREIILIAQDTTRYGTDLEGDESLAKLLTELCQIEKLHWVRVHYLYPEMMTDDLIDVIAKEEKVVKYLDIPIQHINSPILKKMNRRGDGELIRNLFKKLRKNIPNVVLRTSIIAGLPGEGEAEFEELSEFLREAKIERAGVFPFSPEEGTPAATMPDTPDVSVAEHRAELLREIQADIMDEFSMKKIGETVEVLCDDFDEEEDCFVGRSYADSPDIDGLIYFTGDCIPGEFVNVEITAYENGILYGAVPREDIDI